MAAALALRRNCEADVREAGMGDLEELKLRTEN
jgi:hypothetical protein